MTHSMLVFLLVAVLFLPFALKRVEKEIEIFLFFAGTLAMTVSSAWSWHAVRDAAVEPLKITACVLAFGIFFELLRDRIGGIVRAGQKKLGTPLFVFLMVFFLGLLSSVVTAIISALILSEMTGFIRLRREREVRIVVIACFSIGMGAALTPIGEPLSTIVAAKLQGPPYNAGFFFMLNTFWGYILPFILVLSLIAAAVAEVGNETSPGMKEDRKEGMKDVIGRGLKVYIFVAGLMLLGTGFKPLIEGYILKLPVYAIYWINTVSAVLDNATLAAAEISPSMTLLQLKSAVLGLVISGGILIPGNIPNIICANKLKIGSTEWMRYGAEAGALMLVACFAALMVFG